MPDTVFNRCKCGAIADYRERVGTNPQDEDTEYYCSACLYLGDNPEKLEEFDGPVKVTFEWPNGAVETRIPMGFAEAQKQAKEMLNAASDE